MSSEQPCPHWEAHTTQNLQGRMIYKDECTKCFINPKHELGLNVCLATFIGSCCDTSDSHNHSAIHIKNTEHPIFMNIKMVEKAPKDSDQPEKVTRLAIGKPGGVDAETDKYDTLVSCFCTACNCELPMSNPKVASLCDSVLLAQSAYNQSQVEGWELELTTCKHTDELDQSEAKAIADKQMAHCQECDLKSNLWLCMTCGHLGCGRKNYDGSGGNNHAVDHAESTGHHVVCKLGTITPEGSASIHCYACDEERLDKKLGEHLEKLGISISDQVKTEKSLTEMNLEANLSLTLSKVLEEGKQLVPVFGPGYTGMENLGNSCYMNSVVQVLFSQPEFVDYFYTGANEHLKCCTKYSPDCYRCQLSKLAYGLHSGEYSVKKLAKKVVTDQLKEGDQPDEYYQDGIRPQIFKNLIGKGNKDFTGGQQQDAREYFSFILDKLLKGEKQTKSAEDPSDLFSFEYEQRLQCQCCGGVKYNRNKELQLLLALPVSSKCEPGTKVSLADSLAAFFAESHVDDLQCSKCDKKCTFTQRKRFITYPKCLGIFIARQVYDDWVPKKLEVDFQVSEDVLDLHQYGGGKCELKEGEVEIPQDAEMVEPELNAAFVSAVQDLGASENQAKHAVYNTGNSSPELAVAWFFENLSNPAISEPLRVPKAAGAGGASKGNDANPEDIMMITSMGLTEKQAKRGLRKCDNNVERAIDWIFSHMDEPDSEDEMQVDQVSQAAASSVFADNPAPEYGNYKLQSFITHLGSSIHAGHYVCHVKKDNQWVYYNDAKVAITTEPPIGKGYMYFFRKA